MCIISRVRVRSVMSAFRQRWIHTAAAVFLLLFTAVDLAYPQLCTEDGNGGVTTAINSSASLTIGGASSIPDSAPGHVDDCFCCCGHVLVSAEYQIQIPTPVQALRSTLALCSAVHAPRSTFRPPRLS